MNCPSCGTPLVEDRCPSCAPASGDEGLDDARRKLEETRERLGAWRERLSKRLDEFQKKRDLLSAADARRLARAPTARLDDAEAGPLESPPEPGGSPFERSSLEATIIPGRDEIASAFQPGEPSGEAAPVFVPGAGSADDDPLGFGGSTSEPALAEPTLVLREPHPAADAPGPAPESSDEELETIGLAAPAPRAWPAPEAAAIPARAEAEPGPTPWYAAGREAEGTQGPAGEQRPWYAVPSTPFPDTSTFAEGGAATSSALRLEVPAASPATDGGPLEPGAELEPPTSTTVELPVPASASAVAGEIEAVSGASPASGELLPGSEVAASPLRRSAAFVLDLLFLFVLPAVVLSTPVSWTLHTSLAHLWGQHAVPLTLLAGLVFVVLTGLYLGAFGRTPGDRLASVRVIDRSGATPSFGLGLLRAALFPVAAVPGAESLLGTRAVAEP